MILKTHIYLYSSFSVKYNYVLKFFKLNIPTLLLNFFNFKGVQGNPRGRSWRCCSHLGSFCSLKKSNKSNNST